MTSANPMTQEELKARADEVCKRLRAAKLCSTCSDRGGFNCPECYGNGFLGGRMEPRNPNGIEAADLIEDLLTKALTPSRGSACPVCQEAANEYFETRVIHPCPKCGSEEGDWCRLDDGTPLPAYHDVRLATILPPSEEERG